MKVASSPLRWATPLTMRLKRIAWSQARRASSTCRRLTSHWFGPYSARAAPVGTSWASQVAAISVRMSETDSRSDIELICVRVSRRPGQGRAGRLCVAFGGALRVDEIELEFERDDRRPAARGVALEHGIEDVARVAIERRAVVIEHLDLELRDAWAHPRGREKRLCDRHAGPVGVAFVKAEAGCLDRAAEHVERKHRSGQGNAPLIDARKIGTIDPLAAQHAAEIGQQKVDRPGPRDARPEMPRHSQTRPGGGPFRTWRLRSCIARRIWPRGRIPSQPRARQGSCGAT